MQVVSALSNISRQIGISKVEKSSRSLYDSTQMKAKMQFSSRLDIKTKACLMLS